MLKKNMDRMLIFQMKERSEFRMSQNGFIFCSSNLAVVNKNGVEKQYPGQDIDQCNYSNEHFGFNRADSKNKNDRIVFVDEKEYGPYSLIENFTVTNKSWGFKGYISEKDKNEFIINGNNVSNMNIMAGPAVSNEYYAMAYEKDGNLYMKVERNKK